MDSGNPKRVRVESTNNLVTKRFVKRQAVIFIQKIKFKEDTIMSRSRKYVEAREIEREMQESRIKEDFVDKVEEISIKQMVENGSKLP